MLSRWQEARRSASWWAHSSRRESPSGAASRPTGTSPLPSTAVSSTGQAFRGNDGGVSWLPAPHGGGRVSNPRLQAGTVVRQQHCLPAGGHVGPPLRLVTRASPSSHPSPAPRRGGRVSNPRLQAGTVVRQQHCLPAGGHVGPPLRLVTRASLYRPSREGGFQTRAYRRERLSASNIAYRRADTWVRPYGWSRAPLYQGGERPGCVESMGAP